MHVRTGLNVRHADEQLRGTIALPNGLGRDVTVAVFAQGDKAREAEEAGADIVGAEDLAKRVEEGFTDFDVAIATPDLMPVVGRLGASSARRARCPTPRSAPSRWTCAKAVEESKAGKVEYRTDRTAIVHLVIGKRSFDERALLENYAAVHRRADPREARRSPRAATCARSRSPRRWGPGIKVDPSRTRDIVGEARRRGGIEARKPPRERATDRSSPKTPGARTTVRDRSVARSAFDEPRAKSRGDR